MDNDSIFFRRRPDGQLCNRILRFMLSILRPRLDGVALLLQVNTIIRTVSGRCCPIVQTDAAVFPYLCLWRKFDFLSNSDERSDVLPWRPDGWNLELLESSRHWWVSGRMLLTDECSDILLGRPDGNKGSDFSELEFAQNLPWTLK